VFGDGGDYEECGDGGRWRGGEKGHDGVESVVEGGSVKESVAWENALDWNT